ncbi:MAG: biotin carboxylase [Myxococcales bacterium]|nr:biotin carboxylase [Myxococcales bacterium]
MIAGNGTNKPSKQLDADNYVRNPETTRDRKLRNADSAWVRSFDCTDVRPLIVCRGPIRAEAMDVFEQMGIEHYGMLLSEKDSIVYTLALAPELRRVRPEHVHRVRDYTGANKDERVERMLEIVSICKRHGYTHVFAGYGFMAEDAEFVRTLEQHGVQFIGPRSTVQSAAGKKDEAKRTAVAEGVSVTPGIDDVTARTLLRKHPTREALSALVAEHGLAVDHQAFADGVALKHLADAVLRAGYAAGLDLYTVDELCDEVSRCAEDMFAAHPGSRVRLKAIGGGGGKGQRILRGISRGETNPAAAREAASAAPGAVREILAEVKAGGVGDDKNVLLELNVEETRHNEIQLLGNGTWCISLGGRDCSVQMHEQKLLEVSVTQEGLAQAIAWAREHAKPAAVSALEKDLATLVKMEQEAERFGVGVGLNSASTFECIVERDRHFFMEVNTRIQVEHRVSELCYALRFSNPNDPKDSFTAYSIVEVMVLLARHGARLPRPTRVVRHGASIEARLNATDRSLSPHAGGVIQSWTDPIEHEIRDDQGICLKNPDTGVFVRYRLAGAYDSNIALLVTYGDDRRASYERLCEILRRMKLRGVDLQTNNAFHYGLVHWFLSHGVWAKPTTRFVVPYLTAVGLLAEAAQEIDVAAALAMISAHHEKRCAAYGADVAKKLSAATRAAIARKETLVQRPFDALFDEPHVLAAWLSYNRTRFQVTDGKVRWLVNPIEVLADTYWLLNMDFRRGVPAAHVIWEHDHELLETARGFYRRLEERLAGLDWSTLSQRLEESAPPEGFDAALWERVRSAHRGYQLGLELLDLLPLVADRAGFFELSVDDELEVKIPARLTDVALQAKMKRVLSPPPATRANEVVAASGGMFYLQEAPDRPPFVSVGSHFDAGQPLYIIEVMKMFNKVLAPFAGTIDEVLIEGNGTIVQKGQPLFKVTPDVKIVEEDAGARTKRLRASTQRYVDAALASRE